MDSQGRELSCRHTSRQPGDFSQLALWTAANFAGLVTAVLLARGPFFKSLSARVGRGKPKAMPPSPKHSLAMLANAIIGSGKDVIEAVFGPPRSIAIDGLGVLVHPQKIFWHADIWYYPLLRKGAMAIAITFHDQSATRVEFFTTPR